jgi:hypothetical protein
MLPSAPIYKCKPGHHDWQPGSPHFTGFPVTSMQVVSYTCTKCEAHKLPGEADPNPENYAPGACVWID